MRKSCYMDTMERTDFRSAQPYVDDAVLGDALLKVVRDTEAKIDQAFAKKVKYPARLKRA
jgi:hypothetical protein